MARKIGNQAARERAVFRQVVTGEDCKGRHSSCASLSQRPDQQTSQPLGRLRGGQIGGNRWVGCVDPAGRPIEPIALFRNGDRYDPGLRRAKRVQHRLSLRPKATGPGNHANHARTAARCIARDDGIEPVLRSKLRSRFGAAQADTEDAPVTTRGAKRVIGIDRLMRLVERAEANMDDARTVIPADISGTLHVVIQFRSAGQAACHPTAIPCCKPAITPRNSASPLSRPMAG